ncbi:hypothetical protein AB0D94_02860 [Streptomyces sp. NPDC048255]|uniref:hypothetical protein n=1 Tax=Streptomyces sp. NPDC048255 TaxID=3154713 RepID=UPI0033C4778B
MTGRNGQDPSGQSEQHEEGSLGQGGGDLGAFELGLRERMAEDARALRPAALPYPAIVRQGRQERRRRLAAAGAALVALAVVPVVALSLHGGGERAGAVSVAGGGPTKPAPGPDRSTAPPPAPAGPAAPATPGQLADGITMEQAADGLEKCLRYGEQSPSGVATELGKAADYRILLAQRSTGNDNSPGDGHVVVAARDAREIRLICTIKNGEASGVKTHVGSDRDPQSGAVVPDMNGGSLYLQRLSSEGPWKLPYRWGAIGTYEARVAKVTVTYGGTTVEAALDHGRFVATGILERRVTKAPQIKGYDAEGTLVYDSDQDKFHEKTLP